MQPGDRLICAFVDSISADKVFSQWPLHLTILPWFRVDISSQTLTSKLKRAYEGIKPFSITVLHTSQLGYKKQKTVNLVSAAELPLIEHQTRDLLHENQAWIIDEADKSYRQYVPHITHQISGSCNEGENLLCARLFIVEQKGTTKKVVGVVEL
jgi:2'-5' RNA ligase